MRLTLWLNSRWPKNGWARLAAHVAVLAVVWLAILPFIGRQPKIDAYIRRNERLGIDPSAKFYTEIPAMPELFERVQHRRRN
jgi:hypothetical protein